MENSLYKGIRIGGSVNKMDLRTFKEKLWATKDKSELDEIPLDCRPKMPELDFDKDSYVIVSYSRKDFEEVYLFLAYLYNEGYRFWYDNGMNGTDKWLNEYREKFENPNCLGTITFFSDNYISNSTKAELEIICGEEGYLKKNVMISLIPLKDMDPEQLLIHAVEQKRISIRNAAAVEPMLTTIIEEEKSRTIHRYTCEEDIPFLAEKIDKAFSLYDMEKKRTEQVFVNDFVISNGTLLRYAGSDENVVIPPTVETVGAYAFSACKDLKSVTISNRVTAIGEEAFRDCTALEQVKITGALTRIGKNAFCKCAALQQINIPESVTCIEDGAFSGCRTLEAIVLPDSITHIGDYAFSGCLALTAIRIPKGVTEITSNMLFRCKSLETVELHDGITKIHRMAFDSCEKIKDLRLPAGLQDIGRSAFSFCSGLTSLTIPQGVTVLADDAFNWCRGLKEISLPTSLQQLGRNCLDGGFRCKVTYEGTKAQWEQIKLGESSHIFAWRLGFHVDRVICSDGEVTAREMEEKTRKETKLPGRPGKPTGSNPSVKKP